MLTFSFDQLHAMNGVESAGSDTDNSPLQDHSVTIFLSNGFRIISTKSQFGQSLQLEPFPESVPPAGYFATHSQDNSQSDFYKMQNGNKISLLLTDFTKAVQQACGDELLIYLSARHSNILIGERVTHSKKLAQ